MSPEEDLVVMDMMESPIEKPKKGQKKFFSGKQGKHTLKTQVDETLPTQIKGSNDGNRSIIRGKSLSDKAQMA